MEETTKTSAADEPQYWAVIPSPVRYDEHLTPSEKLLYGEISSLTGKTGYCFASNAYFAALYGLTERTIRRMLADLHEQGYIRIEDGNGGRQRRRIYAGINPLALNPDKNVREPGQKCPGNPDKNVPRISKENNKANNPPKAPQGAESVPAWKPDRFAGLWDYYPRHTSKQAAAKAWEKLKPSDELIAEIGRALRRQKACDEWQRGVGIPYLSTYLNQRRWEDELGDFSPADDPAQGGRKDLVQL